MKLRKKNKKEGACLLILNTLHKIIRLIQKWKFNVSELCGGKRCVNNAYCNLGNCVCRKGYHGDGYFICEGQ
jgi:hypothetical protein